MPKHFTHLHVHTEFSLLDGAISLERLIDFAKQHDMKAIGISDHGNIFGAVKFFEMAAKAGIKPILGIETYLTEDARVKDIDNKYYHLLLIVKNQIGYKNLCKLLSYAYTDGFYFKPRIDYKMLEAHSEGLIASTACLGGHIPSLLMQDKDEEAEKYIDWNLKTFGPERFYLEVAPEDQVEQKKLNEKMWHLGQKKGIGIISSCDSHYPTDEDREAHEVMLAIQTHHKITDPDRMTFGNCRVHLRSTEEMSSLFSAHEQAVWQTGVIADQCEFSFQTGKLFFPQFEVPQPHTQDTYFGALCQQGLDELLATGRVDSAQKEIYQKRLDEEIALIIKMGFVGYFLVVSDFIQWAKKNGVPVGPGRGSAAGSLVAWSLQITDIDPIKYHLLFERFLNPERVSMPDIDIDFCIEGRERVINYVRDKYGHDKVCQIITFGTMMAKGVIKDVARVLGFPFEDANALTDLIPDQLKITLKEALEAEPKLKKLMEANPQVAKLMDLAMRLEGLTRHASKHAAGIVISPEAISDVLPVYVPPKSNELVTQYAMTELEHLGFLKMDFLGLKNLTLIKRVIDLITKNHNITLDVNKLPIEDEQTFKLLCAGDTSGVFQLESDGIKDVLVRLQPHVFEDIIAVNALYRPGPLGSGMVDDFIERKHGRQKIKYIFPELEPILKETYGVIVYQEQVMKIASAIAGYTMGEADLLRRAMGKKKAEEMAKHKSLFISKAEARGFDTKKAAELFDLMAYFAGYGFNKSHSAAYALIAYQTAYLKSHYRPEFMACLISLEVSDSEKMAEYIDQAKQHGLEMLPPDINKSSVNFDATGNAIRFGLQGIKNLGAAVLEDLIAERTKSGEFKDMLDLCTRVDLRTCNKRVLENLVSAGAMDCLPGNRAQKFDEVEQIIDVAIAKKKSSTTGQTSLFDFGGSQKETSEQGYVFSPREDWDDRSKLEKEKEVLGVYISAHPLDHYKKHIARLNTKPINQKCAVGSTIAIAGLIRTTKTITTKKGDPMAFLQCEDTTGSAEIVVFPKLYAQVQHWLSQYSTFVFIGEVDTSLDGSCKIKASQLLPLDLIVSQGLGIDAIDICLPATFDATIIASIKDSMKPGKAKLSFVIQENTKKIRIQTRSNVAYSVEFADLIDGYQGTIALMLNERTSH